MTDTTAPTTAPPCSAHGRAPRGTLVVMRRLFAAFPVVSFVNDRPAAPARLLPPLPAVLVALSVLLSAGSTLLVSCDNGGDDGGGEGEGEGEGDDGFDDLTVGVVGGLDDFDALAEAGPSSSALKVVLTRFGTGSERVRFLDSRHYALHDEFYWFRLLNGAAVDGLPDAPGALDAPVTTSHGPFSSVHEIVAWARVQAAAGVRLPLDLTFVDGGLRLYSPRFYNLALFNHPRSLGIATVLHFPFVDDDHPERWALELEFQDVPTEDELRTFLRVVGDALPAAIAERLVWITRSQAQEQLAATLPADLAARTISFSDVVVDGAKEVYSEGLTAGRVLVVHRGEEDKLLQARNTDVLVVDDVPDFLPACAALLTSQPQTALAHVNLLARNRGIPNAFVAGAIDDANLDQLGRVRAPVVVSARAPDDVVVRAIGEDAFATWRTLTTLPPTSVPPIDLTGVEPTYELSTLSFADSERWRPILGGKSTGFLALLDAHVVTVDRPLGVSIAPYVEHLQTTGLVPRLQAMLVDSTFVASVDVRRLVLEGPGAVPADVVDAFRRTHPEGNVLRDLVDDGGVTGVILSTPVAPSTLAAIDDALRANFGRYADTQALRFRSSSNVEDAEGFNGAGLYTSNSGFLHPASGQPSVEDALRETWASYWGSEAFEERRLANVEHLSGSMGCVVHANFPDDVERNNGVATFTVLPVQGQGPSAATGGFLLEVNQQAGSWSVTNPPPGSSHLPEIDRVTLAPGESAPRIERVAGSTLLPVGEHVLDDATLLSMFDDARTITQRWLAVDDAALSLSQRRTTLTLDLETRFVQAGWPALRSGLQLPSRLVWKQARTLEPAAVRVPQAVAQQPLPRDVLSRARRIERRVCAGENVTVTVVEATTDPALFPDMGFAVEPFTSFVIVDEPTGARRSALHTAYVSVDHPVVDDARWSLDIAIDDARVATLHLAQIVIDEEGHVRVQDDVGGVIDDQTTCERTLLYAAPADFLQSLLDEAS